MPGAPQERKYVEVSLGKIFVFSVIFSNDIYDRPSLSARSIGTKTVFVREIYVKILKLWLLKNNRCYLYRSKRSEHFGTKT